MSMIIPRLRTSKTTMNRHMQLNAQTVRKSPSRSLDRRSIDSRHQHLGGVDNAPIGQVG